MKKIGVVYKYVNILFGAFSLFLSSCTTESAVEPDKPDDAFIVEVPVDITIGNEWFNDNPETKALPPESGTSQNIDGTAETVGTDAVRIFVFRRKDKDDISGVNTDAFIYDSQNDQIVSCASENGSHRLIARGKLKKIYGYEYRIVALAYDSDKQLPESGGVYPAMGGEANLFTVNIADVTTYDNFMATIRQGNVWNDFLTGGSTLNDNTNTLSGLLSYGPQFFYGYCHLATDNEPIIKYAIKNANGDMVNNLSLTGVLYRGMAKVEVRLKALQHNSSLAIKRDITWAALLADNLYTQVGLSNYDKFLQAQTVIGNGKYVLVDYKSSVSMNDTIIFTAYVLPTKTHLALRVKLGSAAIGSRMYNGQIYVNDVSFADNATGVISPDVQDNLFYFRRNHKYVLRGDTEKVLNHVLN